MMVMVRRDGSDSGARLTVVGERGGFYLLDLNLLRLGLRAQSPWLCSIFPRCCNTRLGYSHGLIIALLPCDGCRARCLSLL